MRATPYTLATALPKGGTGKTTVALNVAGALADRGRKVLVVDLDTQGNATEGLGRPDAYDADGATIRDVLIGKDTIQFSDVGYQAANDDIGLVPAHASMVARPRVEVALGESKENTERAVKRLSGLIESVSPEVCIIDCPPSPGALTDVGLLTAGHILIPVKASGTSMRALELLLSKKRAVESEFGVEPIEPIGVVANEVRHSGVSDGLLEWLEDTFGDSIPVWRLRQRVALERAWNQGATIYTHSEDCEHCYEIFGSIADTIEGEL